MLENWKGDWSYV